MASEVKYWTGRWLKNEIGWDIGEISEPLKSYFDQLADKSVKVLIPGAGNAYEAEYLLNLGFSNVFVIDISDIAVESFKKRCPNFPSDHIINGDFFDLTMQDFDLIIEQTFFCAINPELRSRYVDKMKDLLKVDGKLVGLLFDFPLKDGPPFGGSTEEYTNHFKDIFEIEKLETAYNSIPPRKGRELFIRLRNAARHE